MFGTLDDFDRLVAEAHRRGIRIMLDLVMNHTSSAHRWFEESRRDPTGPYGDWYLWRDGVTDRFGRTRKPNNWTSFFGGSAWTWDEVRGQFYMHTFLPEQPDVNWRNPAVREAMLTMVRGWLERGVDGFRLDVFNAFFKDEQLLSNPRRYRGRRPYDRQVHLYDKDRPELAGFLTEFRALVDSFPERMTVGELFSGDPSLAPKLSAPTPSRLRLRADRTRTGTPRDSPTPARSTRSGSAATPGRPSCSRTTTDRARRRGSRPAPMPRPATRSLAPRPFCSLTMRGTPFLYYGEEIGARDVPVPWSEIIDPPAKRGGRLVRRLVPWWNRDQARSPMPWGGGGPNGGFSTAPAVAAHGARCRRRATWPSRMPIRRRSCRRTARSSGCAGAIRRSRSDAIGELRGTSRDLYAFERATADQSIIVAVNFGPKATALRVRTRPTLDRALRHARVRAPTELLGDDQLTLAPHEAIILLAS